MQYDVAGLFTCSKYVLYSVLIHCQLFSWYSPRQRLASSHTNYFPHRRVYTVILSLLQRPSLVATNSSQWEQITAAFWITSWLSNTRCKIVKCLGFRCLTWKLNITKIKWSISHYGSWKEITVYIRRRWYLRTTKSLRIRKKLFHLDVL